MTNKRMTRGVVGAALGLTLLPVVGYAADVRISGAVEVEATFGEEFGTANPVATADDIALSTVELGFDADVAENMSIHVLLLHEDDDTEENVVDEGTLTYEFMSGLYFTGGRMYVPFGAYESHMVTDPLTVDLGEMREAALQLGADIEGFYGSVYFFNGDTNETATAARGDDKNEHAGLNVGFAQEGDDLSFDVGFDYINSIGDSDGISDYLSNNTSLVLDSYVSGFAVHGMVGAGPFTVIAEYVQADQFNAAELAFNGQGAEPAAFNLEAGFTFDALGKATTIAVGYQSTDEAVSLGLPETRVAGSLAIAFDEQATLAFEYKNDEDYSQGDGGTGENYGAFTTQLAFMF